MLNNDSLQESGSSQTGSDFAAKIIKISEFSQFVKKSFEISINKASKSDSKIAENNYNPIRYLFRR